jgi:hypothetical protein
MPSPAPNFYALFDRPFLPSSLPLVPFCSRSFSRSFLSIFLALLLPCLPPTTHSSSGFIPTMVSLYLQVVLLVLLGTSWADKRCYFPDGSGTSDNYPCDPDAEDSVCCGGARGSYCMSNKLCGNGDGNTIRGACTDPDWRTGECPFFCMSEFLRQAVLDCKAF